MSDYRTIARLEDVPEKEPTAFDLEGRDIVVIRVDGTVHALEDRCSHEDFPLSAGAVLDGQIECALHGARFEMASGKPKALPAVQPVKVYDCRVEGDEIQVRIDA
jgi:3-phenylpropionate/trans-cinnamate dioxygenase ferredoxin subunit